MDLKFFSIFCIIICLRVNYIFGAVPTKTCGSPNEEYAIDPKRPQNTCATYGCLNYVQCPGTSETGECYCKTGFARLIPKGPCISIKDPSCAAKLPPTPEDCRKKPNEVFVETASYRYARLPDKTCVKVTDKKCLDLCQPSQPTCSKNEEYAVDPKRPQNTCEKYGCYDEFQCPGSSETGGCYCKTGFARLFPNGPCVSIKAHRCAVKLPPTPADCKKRPNEVFFKYSGNRMCENTCENYKLNCTFVYTYVPNWAPWCDCQKGYARLPDKTCVKVTEKKCFDLYQPKCSNNEEYAVDPRRPQNTCKNYGCLNYVQCPLTSETGECYCKSGFARLFPKGPCVSIKNPRCAAQLPLTSEDCKKRPNEVLYETASYRMCENSCENYKKNCTVINTLVATWAPRCDCQEGYARLPDKTCVKITDTKCLELYQPKCSDNEEYAVDPKRPQNTCEKYGCLGHIQCPGSSETGECYCKSGFARLSLNGPCVSINDPRCAAKLPPTAEDCKKRPNEVFVEFAGYRMCENTCENYKRDCPVINTLVATWAPWCDCQEGYARLTNKTCAKVTDKECSNLYQPSESQCKLRKELYRVGNICESIPDCADPTEKKSPSCFGNIRKPLCYCPDGYLRNKQEFCVPKDRC